MVTHCIRGHEYTEENTYRKKDNTRMCRTCGRERSANLRKKNAKRYYETIDELGVQELKHCRKCNLTKSFSEFRKNKSNKFGLASTCKSCCEKAQEKLHAENPEKRKIAAKKAYTKRKFGISVQEYENKLSNQNYKCYICNSDISKKNSSYLDHDHSSGIIRKFLCYKCNVGLGYFNDSAELLILAANYLTDHKKEEGRS